MIRMSSPLPHGRRLCQIHSARSMISVHRLSRLRTPLFNPQLSRSPDMPELTAPPVDFDRSRRLDCRVTSETRLQVLPAPFVQIIARARLGMPMSSAFGSRLTRAHVQCQISSCQYRFSPQCSRQDSNCAVLERFEQAASKCESPAPSPRARLPSAPPRASDARGRCGRSPRWSAPRCGPAPARAAAR